MLFWDRTARLQSSIYQWALHGQISGQTFCLLLLGATLVQVCSSGLPALAFARLSCLGVNLSGGASRKLTLQRNILVCLSKVLFIHHSCLIYLFLSFIFFFPPPPSLKKPKQEWEGFFLDIIILSVMSLYREQSSTLFIASNLPFSLSAGEANIVTF